MAGCQGRLLRVDLSSGRIQMEEIPECLRRDFVGGRGLGIKYLYDELPPRVEPLSAANRLILAAGVLAGTSAPGFSRWVAMSRSPLTGAVARAVGGGNFGAYLRFAGYEVLVIEGRAAVPVYLHVEEGRATIREAGPLWGLDTRETQARLKDAHGAQAQVACIGPAGEHLVRFATITHERRTAARCGVGTVMGAKRLKAVVVQGNRRPVPADPAAFRQLVGQYARLLRDDPRRRRMTAYGTTTITEMANYLGFFPVRNFRAGQLEGFERLGPEAWQSIKLKNTGCYGCPTRCGKVYQVQSGPYRGAESEGPEYETIWAFGGQLEITEPGLLVAADDLCDRLGLDTISTGNLLGFACELRERGILTPVEVGGLELDWGRHDTCLEMIRRIAYRDGLGDVLADGVQRAAARIGRGADRFAMHVKGLEMPAYDPRAVKGYALSYATSNIGASHMYGRPRHELYSTAGQGAADRFAETGKGDVIARAQVQQAADEVAIVCNLGNSGLTRELLGQLLAAATGEENLADPACLDRVGERILCLERAFNVREGFRRRDDTLPERMFNEPLANAGPATGQVVSRLDALLDEYYAALGYTEQGVPSPERLEWLGLPQVAGDLWPDAASGQQREG